MTGNSQKWQRKIVCKNLLLVLLKFRLLLLICLASHSFNTISVRLLFTQIWYRSLSPSPRGLSLGANKMLYVVLRFTSAFAQ